MLRPLAWLILLTATLALGVPRSATAQSELQTMLDPTFGKLIFRSDYRITFYPDQRVERQPAELGFTEHRVSLSIPLWQDSRNEWTAFTNADLEDFHTRAVLPDTKTRFPGELWDVRFGTTYRHKLDNDWIAGGSLMVGSASDKPFSSKDELFVRAMGFLRVPRDERNAWILSLIYASDSEFLGGIPIPGIAYQYTPSERFRLVIGVPFSSVEYRPFEKLTLEASYFPVRKVRARATYEVFRPLRVWAGFDWDHEHHFRAGRFEKDDKLFYYEKRLAGGIRFDLRNAGIEVYGGRTFDRFYFEGDSYSERNRNRIDVHDGWFGAARVSVRY